MQFIRPDINIPFIPNVKKFLVASSVIVVASWLVILVFGLNYGIDFAGGTEVQVKFNKDVSTAELREAMTGLVGISSEVQRFGAASRNEYLIKLSNISFVNEKRESDIKAGLGKAYGETGFRRYHHSTAGGDKIEFTMDKKVKEEEIKEIFKAADAPAQDVVITGLEGRFVYRCVLAGLTPHISDTLSKSIGPETFEILRVDSVGPKIGEELKWQGLTSIFWALVCILAYIALRFNFRFAPGAVAALVHDVSITVGIFAILQVEFTIPIIAALLTIVGYSLNDTIVVFDRIRENLSKAKVKSLEDVVNESINQTLSRTILTSMTTLMVVIALLIFGGAIIRDFAFALLIGVLVGTYSSVFIASPLMIYLHHYFERRSRGPSSAKLKGRKDRAKARA